MIAVLGGESQLALSMQYALADKNIRYFTRSDVDILSLDSISRFQKSFQPSVIINCSAYTNVNQAEEDKINCDLLNVSGINNLALVFGDLDAHIINISTDYVFDGEKGSPYIETDPINPLNYYGISKAMGEKILIDSNLNFTIIRTSWLFSPFKDNFLKKIFFRSLSNDDLQVTASEIGSPTDAIELAFAIEKLINNLELAKSEIFHFSGNTFLSWHDFANDIIRIGFQAGFLNSDTPASKFVSKDLPDVIRPKYSALSSQKFNNIISYKHQEYEDSIMRALNIIQKNSMSINKRKI
jgi:dTDP-4-dehydrorhamnose reductase